MDGILNVCKPVGPTSHDIVSAVRRLSKQKRVGHAGTLDPAAAGVLLVCLGQATRVIEYMADYDKEYCAEITLGQSTDTYDATGRPTSAVVSPSLSREQVVAAMAGFVGQIEQVPPPFSAIKQAGQPLYRLARAGKAVQVPRRTVTIYSFDLLAWEPPNILATVRCSKGTYVRSLAHDLGQRLGVGGHLRNLIRLASGPFGIDDAVTLDELSAAFAEDYADKFLYPLDEPLLGLPAVIVAADTMRDIQQGKRWPGPEAPSGQPLCRAYSTAGDMIALLEHEVGVNLWRPRKVFAVGQ